MKDAIKRIVEELVKSTLVCVIGYVVPKIGDKIIAKVDDKSCDAVQVDTFRS